MHAGSDAVWYLMRSTGVVSMVLLTAVMALGIATVNRWSPRSTPRFVTPALHRSLALLSIVFVGVHVATAVIDPYAAVGAVAVVVPFAAAGNPFWVGLGAVSLDLIAALIVSSLVRRRLGYRAWRAVHWLAYLSWPVALAHGIGMGTDAASLWFDAVALACVATVSAAVVWRLSRRPGTQLEPQALRAAA
jgi:methionine sulfoxide reductase heme-binding subunit